MINGGVTWRDSKEINLWPVVLIQIVCVIPMTVIPGRLANAKANTTMQLLSQKQSYVRFVSHEIRSPLSIVSAGLEFAIGMLSGLGELSEASRIELLDLATDVAEATDTAVNILNDLLQYESMDAGMFKIEPASVEPSDLVKANILAIIAKRYSLNLEVVPPKIEDKDVFVLADMYRVDQVVRNLVLLQMPISLPLVPNTTPALHVQSNVHIHTNLPCD